ncbi:MAG: hypothetical protein RL595_102, partial [Planctomycetota bacterium]
CAYLVSTNASVETIYHGETNEDDRKLSGPLYGLDQTPVCKIQPEWHKIDKNSQMLSSNR